MSETIEKMRLDKWLWAARFYKTRSLAANEIARNRVQVNEQAAKPSREIKVGDHIYLKQGSGLNVIEMNVQVMALSSVRGPAPVAQTLYAEDPKSIEARQIAREKRRLMNEPAASIENGRPTKRDRRQLAQWDRWSVSSNEADL